MNFTVKKQLPICCYRSMDQQSCRPNHEAPY